MKQFLLLILLPLTLSCQAQNDSQGAALQADSLAMAADTVVSQADTLPTLSLLFAGDMMQHAPQFKAARTREGAYDYSGCFDQIQAEVSRADVAIANLETTLGSKTFAGYPCFSSPTAWAEAIRDAGFDLLLTANNHSVDRGARGIRRTIEVLDSLNIPHVGTYVDAEAREQQSPYIIEAKGFRIALLCYTYGTNGITVPQPFIVNPLDTALIGRDIDKARAMGVDAIIAMPHWGLEYKLLPSPQQRKMADWMLRRGVTHVVGGHPHVIQPIEVRSDTLTDQRHLVAFSLGNYVSHMTSVNCTGGMMLRMTLTRDEQGRCILGHADYALIWVSRPEISGQRVHRVVPVSYPDSLLKPRERQLRDTFMHNARDIFMRHNLDIEEYFF